MVGSQLEKVYYHYIFKNRDYADSVTDRFFDTGIIKDLFNVAKEFYDKYKTAPTKKQIEELVKLKGLEDTISKEKIDLIYREDLSNYDEVWLKENIEAWIEYRNFDLSVLDLINFLQISKPDVSNVKDIITKGKSIISERNNLSFNFDGGLDFFDPSAHIQPTSETFSTGYSHLDLVTGGGYSAKTLWCFIGRAKIGKSTWLSNLAAKSVRAGNNTAYLSMEMADRKVVKRLGANLLGVKMQEYNKFADDQITLKKRLANIGMNDLQTPGRFFIKEFPTSTASVNDVENYLLKMEDINNMKFKVVFVDYINIMKNWRNPNTENLYMKIKQIAEDLRAMAVRNKWAVVTCTQINRSGFDGTDLSLSNVSESAALIHTVDAMFGIIQDVMMHANREYILKLLANRDEGYMNTKKKFNVNYDYMRIDEDLTSQMWSED